MKIDPYYQRQKCRPMILVSGNIRFMEIFVGVFIAPKVAIFAEKIAKLHY